MASYLITGASRGLGLGLCTTLAARPASEVSVVFAAARTITDALKDLASRSNGRVEIVPVDVTKEEDVKKAVAQVEQSLNGKGLDVLFNNAGVMNWTFAGIQHM
jgi:NAD(P)-dependent dehydrogenase (short-subunit alcohol dehydrogenase family)